MTTGAAIERVGRRSASSGVGTRRKRERDRGGRGLGGVGRRTPLSDGQCTVRGSRQSGGCRRAAAAAPSTSTRPPPSRFCTLHSILEPHPTSRHLPARLHRASARLLSVPRFRCSLSSPCSTLSRSFPRSLFCCEHHYSSSFLAAAERSLCLLALSVRLPLRAALAAAHPQPPWILTHFSPGTRGSPRRAGKGGIDATHRACTKPSAFAIRARRIEG